MKRVRRKQNYKELLKLHSSPNVIRQIKSKRTNWVGHVARERPEGSTYKVLVGKLEIINLWIFRQKYIFKIIQLFYRGREFMA